MLENTVDRNRVIKKIAIVTCSDALTELLQILVQHWQYEIHRPDDTDVLLLAEEGCAAPVEGQKAIWLTRSQYQGRDRISMPLEFENFWQTLELRFHKPPRKHIRMNVEMEATINVGDESVTTTLSSLSDMGCRFSYYRELVRDEQVYIDLEVDGEQLKIDSRVIYSIPRSATYDQDVRIGLLFRGIEKGQRDQLRSSLICRYLEKVQAEMEAICFKSALENFALSDRMREKLGI